MKKPKQRPLSPHLSIYRPQLTSLMSIAHRITGAALAVGSGIIVWWLVALAAGPRHYATAQSIITSPIGQIIMVGFTVALYYHLANGIRHLAWDAGYGLELPAVYKSGYAVIALVVILTGATWLPIWCG